MTQLLGVCLLAAAAASAQSYSQPVREIEKEARSAVRGLCELQFPAGYSNLTAGTNCALQGLGSSYGTTVPAGKILVIEEITAVCQKALADRWAVTQLNASGHSRTLPMKSQVSFPNGSQIVADAGMARIYVKSGDAIILSINLVGSATMPANCSVGFQGHLVNIQ